MTLRATAMVCAWACAALALRAQDAAPPAPLPPVDLRAQPAPEVLPNAPPEFPPLTLSDVEQLALAANPALAEAAAQVRAARGEAYQAGLPPNPVVGYSASEIGNSGDAGQQGLLVGQEFVRGNKLGLDRAVAGREAARLDQRLAAQRLRVLTDVRIAFYQAYLAERRVDLSRRLRAVGVQAVDTADALLRAQEGRRIDLLQAEIEAQRAAIDVAQAEANYRGAWRRLAAAVGQPDLPARALAGELDEMQWNCTWNETLGLLWEQSPEVAAALVAIDKARVALARARVEPIPNVTAQATVQYDAATNDTVAGAQATLPLPLWNRNQGGIARAYGELVAARRRLEMVELRLQRDLADEYQAYEFALARTATIRDEILGRAQETLDTTLRAYEAGEVTFLDFLTAQRTYFQANLEYLDALGQLCTSVETLRGLLLAGSYDHIDAPVGP